MASSNKQNGKGGKDKKAPQRIATVAKAGRRSKSGGRGQKAKLLHKELSAPLKTMDDVHALNLHTGDHLELGCAIYEFTAPSMLRLMKVNGEDALASHVGIHHDIFVTFGQLRNPEFDSSLSNGRRAKQEAMWNHARTALGKNGLDDLKSFSDNMRALQQEQDRLTAENIATTEEKIPRFISDGFGNTFIGESLRYWNDATADVAKALESLTPDHSPVEIRFGKTCAEGVVFGIWYDAYGNALIVGVGSVGEKSPLHMKVLPKTRLNCRFGKIQETFNLETSPEIWNRIRSAKEIHGYLLGLPRSLRDPFMESLQKAFQRIRSTEPTQTVGNIVPIRSGQHTEQRPQGTAPQFGTRRDSTKESGARPETKQAAAIAPAMESQKQTPETSKKDTCLADYIATLREAGVEGAELAKMVLAYKGSTSTGTVATA
jgi:hypothetical protein